MKEYLLLISSLFLLTACSAPSGTSVAEACEYKGIAYDVGESYFDGCNWHTCQESGDFIGTEMACEPNEDPISKDNSDYENLLQSYPSVDEDEVFHSDFLDNKILYPFDELYSQILSGLSESDRTIYGQALEDCRPNMAASLFAFPGYEYEEVSIYENYSYKRQPTSPTEPFLFIGLFADLYVNDDTNTRDQYDFLIREGECDVRIRSRVIPDEEQEKIVGYLLRLPQVEEGLFGQKIDEVSVSTMQLVDDGSQEVFVDFRTSLEEDQTLLKYSWYGLSARLNLVTGDLEVTPYQYHEEDIFIGD